MTQPHSALGPVATYSLGEVRSTPLLLACALVALAGLLTVGRSTPAHTPTSSLAADAQPPLILSVDTEGRFTLNGKSFDSSELSREKLPQGATIRLLAPSSMPLPRFIEILNALKKEGVACEAEISEAP